MGEVKGGFSCSSPFICLSFIFGLYKEGGRNGRSKQISISAPSAFLPFSREKRQLIMFVKVAILSCLLGIAAAHLPYIFSDGYLEVLGGEPEPYFTCDNRPYGYYADVQSGCRVFHVCLPLADETGNVYDTFQYSFFCGNQTLFSQEALTCSHPENAFPCDQAESIYELSNADFGRIPDEDF